MRAQRIVTSAAGLLAGSLLLTVFGGAASAFWTGIGSGSGTASTVDVVPITVSLTPQGELYPGQPAQSVVLVLSNPNTRPVVVTRVAPGALTVSGGAACTAGTSAVAFATLDGSWTVPAAGSTTTTLAAGVSMGPTSASGCQGASFSAALAVTAGLG